MIDALFIVGAYFWGGIPSAYLVGRYRKGIDIRGYGSGNVGATNLMAHVGVRTGLFLGGFDCVIKGTVPVLVAKYGLDMSLAAQAATGLAAIAGHNWSPYIQFTGGRGVATAIGAVLGMLMWREFLILGFVMGFIGHFMFREMGFWTFVAMLTLPVLAFAFGQPAEIIYMSLGVTSLLVLKRLVPGWNAPQDGYPLSRVLMYRVLWDRDVPRKSQWLERRPRPGEKGSPGDGAD